MMLVEGFIHRSNSGYGGPVIFVAKRMAPRANVLTILQ